MRPLIGITMDIEVQSARTINKLDQDYGKAVFAAGGIPVPVVGNEQLIPDLIKRLDGFLFTGGGDIHPRFYHERPIAGAKLDLASDIRVRFEMKLVRAAVKARKPVLAICYGAQLANVALGGTLFQDIGRQVRGSLKHGPSRAGEKVFHPISIFEATKLCRIMGNCCGEDCAVKVRSSHHQSIKNPGRGMRLAAVSPDGLYEALESRGKSFLLAVQWHPEKTPADRATRNLFGAFVSACRSS